MNAREWLAAFAEKLGTEPPTTDEFKTLLNVAGEAAHSSERVAAPVSCWLVAKAGVDPDEALRIAREVGGDTDSADDG
jgi:ADP-ribosylglycohydrolase